MKPHGGSGGSREPDSEPDGDAPDAADVEIPERPSLEDGTEAESYRPALVKLTADMRELRDDLISGFSSRTEVLEWGQRLAVVGIGMAPPELFDGIGDAVAPLASEGPSERVLLSVLLEESARERTLELEESTDPETVRESLASTWLTPIYRQAFRQLRRDATEYTDPDESISLDPLRERNPAMRPVLAEVDRRQRDALTRLLEGLERRAEIPEWGEAAELATFGELPGEFVTRAHDEQATARVLTGGERYRAVRAALAGEYLLPAFNRGVRTLAGRAGEIPSPESEPTTPTHI